MSQEKDKKKKRDLNLPGFGIGVKVPGPASHDIEVALRLFKRKFKESGIVEELRDRMYFNSPSQLKHEHDQKKKRSLEIENKQNKERNKKNL